MEMKSKKARGEDKKLNWEKAWKVANGWCDNCTESER
jgi:hypothetical protein